MIPTTAKELSVEPTPVASSIRNVKDVQVGELVRFVDTTGRTRTAVKVDSYGSLADLTGLVQNAHVPIKPVEIVTDPKVREKYLFSGPPLTNVMWKPANAGTTIGADPEIFVVNKDGVVIPAWTFLPEKNKAIETMDGRLVSGTMFYDGFQAEWTTISGPCLGFQVDYVRAGLLSVLREAQKKHKDAKLSVRSVVDIPYEVMSSTNPEHLQLGCSPSMNVYGEGVAVPDEPRLIPYRSAGWHMHFAVRDMTNAFPHERFESAVRMLDRIVGVGMVPFAQSFRDTRRREMYGRAGEYRLNKTLEYRVPEVILGAHPATWNMWWGIARQAFWLGLKELDYLWIGSDDEVREAINASDVKLATKLIHDNERLFRRMFEVGYGSKDIIDASMSVMLNGIESKVQDPTDIHGNWKLGEDVGIGEGGGGEWIRWVTSAQRKGKI